MTASTCGSCGARSPDSSAGGLCACCLLGAALADDSAASLEDDRLDGLSVGMRFGAFTIHRPLGRGGMGAVYEALETQLDRPVALKILPAEFLHDPSFARRFEAEARLIARLEHPHIVPIYASGIENGIPWMSMRLLTGNALSALLAERRLAAHEVLRLLKQIAAALDYAHGRGVAHRDIKPSNILLDESGTAFVADFGLAQLVQAEGRLTQSGILTGTPHYMAPEQALGKRVDHRCDIYSLGIVAYEMLAGATPFSARSPVALLMQHVNDPLPVPDAAGASRWMGVLGRATAKQPEQRWPSAGAFVEALETSLTMPAGDLSAPPQLQAVRGAAISSPVRIGLIAGVLVAGIAILWGSTRQLPDPEAAGSHSPSQNAPVDGAVPAPPSNAAAATPSDPVAPTESPGRQSATAPRAPVSGRATLPPPPPSGAQAAQPREDSLNVAATSPIPAGTPPTPAEEPSLAGAPLGPLPPAGVSQRLSIDVVTKAEPLHKVEPSYPPVAKRAGLQGEVILTGVVGADGRVTDIDVIRSVHPLLGEAARKAFRDFVYRPAMRNGVPHPERVQYTFRFRYIPD